MVWECYAQAPFNAGVVGWEGKQKADGFALPSISRLKERGRSFLTNKGAKRGDAALDIRG